VGAFVEGHDKLAVFDLNLSGNIQQAHSVTIQSVGRCPPSRGLMGMASSAARRRRRSISSWSLVSQPRKRALAVCCFLRGLLAWGVRAMV
jgi:hypothetical protein